MWFAVVFLGVIHVLCLSVWVSVKHFPGSVLRMRYVCYNVLSLLVVGGFSDISTFVVFSLPTCQYMVSSVSFVTGLTTVLCGGQCCVVLWCSEVLSPFALTSQSVSH